MANLIDFMYLYRQGLYVGFSFVVDMRGQSIPEDALNRAIVVLSKLPLQPQCNRFDASTSNIS